MGTWRDVEEVDGLEKVKMQTASGSNRQPLGWPQSSASLPHGAEAQGRFDGLREGWVNIG